MDYQATTDFMITNLDRHLNNFGILRDCRTLKAKGPAPIFDSGNSMLHTRYTEDSPVDLLERTVSSLCMTETQMMEHVSSFSDIDLDRLPAKSEIIDFYRQDESIGYNLERIAETFAYKANIVRLLKLGIPLSVVRKGIVNLIMANPELAYTGRMNSLLETDPQAVVKAAEKASDDSEDHPRFGKGLTQWLNRLQDRPADC